MRKLILDTAVIAQIFSNTDTVNNTDKDNSHMDNNTTIREKRNLANKYFEEACQILGVKYDSASGKYRDISTGRYVAKKLLWDLVKMDFKGDLEFDFLDNPTGIKEVDPTTDSKEPKDALGDLPNWSTMSNEAILASCIYMKKQVLNDGRITKRPLMQATVCEDGEIRPMPIPVRRASDGNEYGYNRWGKQAPEDMYLARATKAAEYLKQWDQEELVCTLDNEVDRLKGGLVTSEHIHPYQDGEDVIQAMLLRQAEKKLEKIKTGKRRLVKLLKLEKANQVWNLVKNEVEILSQETNWPGDDFQTVAEKIRTIQTLIINKVNTMLESWEEIPGFGRVTTGGGMTKEAWIEISTAVSTFAWGSITGSLNPEVKGALWGTAARYVSNMLALEMLEVLAEDNSVDRQTEAIVGEKTHMDEFFQKEELDWAWNGRVQDFEDMPRGWLGRLPWQDKIGAEKIED